MHYSVIGRSINILIVLNDSLLLVDMTCSTVCYIIFYGVYDLILFNTFVSQLTASVHLALREHVFKIFERRSCVISHLNASCTTRIVLQTNHCFEILLKSYRQPCSLIACSQSNTEPYNTMLTI